MKAKFKSLIMKSDLGVTLINTLLVKSNQETEG